tara:strand:- start:12022 stop:12840 length:819 start_codon:yes stop_codon:yes gene_type:complete
MGKFFNKDNLNFKMAKLAFTKPENFQKTAQAKGKGGATPGVTEHHSNFTDSKGYVANLTKFYQAAGDKDPSTSAKKYSTANPWTAAPQGSDYKAETKYQSAVVAYYKPGSQTTKENDKKVSDYLKDNPWRVEEGKGGDMDMGKNEGRGKYNEEFDKALDSPYAGAGRADVYRAVRRARMSKMFNKLRKSIGKKRAKDVMNRSEMVMRERKELVRSDIDRMDQGDPNSVVSMVYEGPESQARYEEGAKRFKTQLDTLKVSHFPSGGSGIKELD